MKEFNPLILLSCVSVLSVSGQSDVTGSHEPVRATVGHYVILPCHLEPKHDVRTLTVEWRRNESGVHKYRSRQDFLEDQDENFRGRTSLFLAELHDGNISLKLTNVTEQDEGNYTCFVPKLDSQVRRGFIQLRVEENRNKDSGSVKKKINNNRHHGFIALIIPIFVIVAIVVIVMWRRRVKNNAGGDGRGGHEQAEMVEVDDSREEGQVKDETGEDDTDISLTQQTSTLRDKVISRPPS